ncbi:MAG TPA: DciA family protein [Candidatus Cybelea sp.]|nr:DciA family protein [Candidatus Cybelea sp.]
MPSLRALAGEIAKLTRPAMKRRGFFQGDVLTRWPVIVGEELAKASCPEKLMFPTGESTGATLQVRVSGGFALEMQHLANLVVERINTFYGFRAVERLRLVQGPLPVRKRAGRRPARDLTAAEEAAIEAAVAKLDDPGLRLALHALGRQIKAARPGPAG